MEQTNEFKKVSMNLSKKSIDNIDDLSSLIHEGNKTRVVSTALEVAKAILSQVNDGKTIIIRKNDGSEQEIKFIVS